MALRKRELQLTQREARDQPVSFRVSKSTVTKLKRLRIMHGAKSKTQMFESLIDWEIARQEKRVG